MAWRSVHNYFTNPAMIVPGAALPAVLLHRVRRRPLARGLGARLRLRAPATRPSSTASCCSRRPPSAASSPASRSRATSSRASRGGCMLGAPSRGGIVAGYWLAGARARVFTIMVITTVALIVGHGRRRQRDRPGRPVRARAARERVRHAVRQRGGDAAAHHAGRARDADAGLPAALPRPGLAALRPAHRLGAGRRHGQPGHAVARDRARLHRRRPDARCCWPSRWWRLLVAVPPCGRAAACAAPSAPRRL